MKRVLSSGPRGEYGKWKIDWKTVGIDQNTLVNEYSPQQLLRGFKKGGIFRRRPTTRGESIWKAIPEERSNKIYAFDHLSIYSNGYAAPGEVVCEKIDLARSEIKNRWVQIGDEKEFLYYAKNYNTPILISADIHSPAMTEVLSDSSELILDPLAFAGKLGRVVELIYVPCTEFEEYEILITRQSDTAHSFLRGELDASKFEMISFC